MITSNAGMNSQNINRLNRPKSAEIKKTILTGAYKSYYTNFNDILSQTSLSDINKQDLQSEISRFICSLSNDTDSSVSDRILILDSVIKLFNMSELNSMYPDLFQEFIDNIRSSINSIDNNK